MDPALDGDFPLEGGPLNPSSLESPGSGADTSTLESASRPRQCPDCRGLGTEADGTTCPRCNGGGVVGEEAEPTSSSSALGSPRRSTSVRASASASGHVRGSVTTLSGSGSRCCPDRLLRRRRRPAHVTCASVSRRPTAPSCVGSASPKNPPTVGARFYRPGGDLAADHPAQRARRRTPARGAVRRGLGPRVADGAPAPDRCSSRRPRRLTTHRVARGVRGDAGAVASGLRGTAGQLARARDSGARGVTPPNVRGMTTSCAGERRQWQLLQSPPPALQQCAAAG